MTDTREGSPLAAPSSAAAPDAAPNTAPAPRSRPGVPFLPAIFVAAALLFLGVAAGTWWANREATPSSVDIGFADDMTTHHLQAVDMARIYERNGANADLISRAQEIEFEQIGEIRVMQDALAEWDEEGTPDTAMQWMGETVAQDEMPGLASAAEMDALSAATGAELDDLFTQLMIDHHDGGLHMAEYAAGNARLEDTQRFASQMATTQAMEIDELNHARRDLGLPIHRPNSNRGS